MHSEPLKIVKSKTATIVCKSSISTQVAQVTEDYSGYFGIKI